MLSHLTCRVRETRRERRAEKNGDEGGVGCGRVRGGEEDGREEED